MDEITRIEDRYCKRGESSLGEAFEALRDRWEQGERDRETALRLLFLSWYTLAEPVWLTGLPDSSDVFAWFKRVSEHLDETLGSDKEYHFVLGYMATAYPWCCGDEAEWAKRGPKHLKKVKSLESAVDPGIFSGRGAYGQYFEHIAKQGWPGTRT